MYHLVQLLDEAGQDIPLSLDDIICQIKQAHGGGKTPDAAQCPTECGGDSCLHEEETIERFKITMSVLKFIPVSIHHTIASGVCVEVEKKQGCCTFSEFQKLTSRAYLKKSGEVLPKGLPSSWVQNV